MVYLQAALAEQFVDIAERARVPKLPAHGAQNQLGLRVSPLEDRRSNYLLHHLFRLAAAVGHSCNTTLDDALEREAPLDPLNDRLHLGQGPGVIRLDEHHTQDRRQQ